MTRRQAVERLPPRRGLAWVQALAGVLGPLLVAIAAALALALVFVSALLSVFDGSGGDEGARVSGEVVAWVSGLGLTGLAGLVAYPIVAITGMAPVRVPANAKTQP